VSDWTPRPKIAAAATAGPPVAVVLVWLLSLFGVTMPEYVAVAVAALIAAGAGYLCPEGAQRTKGPVNLTRRLGG